MAQYIIDESHQHQHLIHNNDSPSSYHQSKPLNMDTKLIQHQENKGSFCIDALLSRGDGGSADNTTIRPSASPANTSSSRSISPTSTIRSRGSPPISPGSEEIIPHHQNNAFVPRPGLLNHVYPSGGGNFYGYHHQSQQTSSAAAATAAASSAFHSLDGTMLQKVQIPVNHHGHSQLHQMQLEWLARTGMFYPRLPDLTGRCSQVWLGQVNNLDHAVNEFKYIIIYI